MDLNPDQVFALIRSSDPFPIDFDDAWQWIGYSRKSNAKRALKNAGFIEGLDYISSGEGLLNDEQEEWGEKISLTIDCFKSWAMMAETPKGREVRKYFIQCEIRLKEIISRGGFVADLDRQVAAWEQRHNIRVYLKDCLRTELMDVIKAYAVKHGESPITLCSAAHDAMNVYIQGHKAKPLKNIGGLSKRALLRDHYEASPLVDYSAINRLAINNINDRGLHPVDAVKDACHSYFGKNYSPKVIPISENIHLQGRRLKAERARRQLSNGLQLCLPFSDQGVAS